MPRLRVTVSLCIVVLVGATVMALWMSAWPRMHDRATEAAVAARGAGVKVTPNVSTPTPRKARADASTRHTPTMAPPAAAAAPAPLEAPSPPYPMAALRKRLGGVVILRVGVDGSGAVTTVDVAQSSGHPLLDASARRTMQRWRFEPPAGHRPMQFDYPVRFRVGEP